MKKIKVGKNSYTLVDDLDFEKFSQFKWHLSFHSQKNHTKYAVRRIKLRSGSRTTVYLHREIMGNIKGKEVDHRNGNGLDNRKENLRFCSRSQNNMNQSLKTNNTSGLKGVDWFKPKSKWRARIGINGKRITIGYFSSKMKAFREYCNSAKMYHGEFSRVY